MAMADSAAEVKKKLVHVGEDLNKRAEMRYQQAVQYVEKVRNNAAEYFTAKGYYTHVPLPTVRAVESGSQFRPIKADTDLIRVIDDRDRYQKTVEMINALGSNIALQGRAKIFESLSNQTEGAIMGNYEKIKDLKSGKLSEIRPGIQIEANVLEKHTKKLEQKREGYQKNFESLRLANLQKEEKTLRKELEGSLSDVEAKDIADRVETDLHKTGAISEGTQDLLRVAYEKRSKTTGTRNFED